MKKGTSVTRVVVAEIDNFFQKSHPNLFGVKIHKQYFKQKYVNKHLF